MTRNESRGKTKFGSGHDNSEDLADANKCGIFPDAPKVSIIDNDEPAPEEDADSFFADLTGKASLIEADPRPKWKQNFRELSHDEEIALFDLKRAGDKLARKEIIERYRPLCATIASQYRGSLNIDDATSAAMIGLVAAVDSDTFDPEMARLSTYAKKFMKFAVRNEARKARVVKPPRENVLDPKIYHALNPIGNPPEWAKGQYRTEKSVQPATEVSFDAPRETQDGEDRSLHDEIGADWIDAESILNQAQERAAFLQAVETLDDREQQIVHARHVLEDALTLEETGELLAICGERVRQVEIEIIDKLKQQIASLRTNDSSRSPRSVVHGPVQGGYVTKSGYFRSDRIERQYVERVAPRSLEPEWFAHSYLLPDDAFAAHPNRSAHTISPTQAVYSPIERRVRDALFPRRRANRSYRQRCQDLHRELVSDHGDSPLRAVQRMRWVILKWCRARHSEVRAEPPRIAA
jgi:RNA polymerase sigma factor (sigma-70 family)